MLYLARWPHIFEYEKMPARSKYFLSENEERDLEAGRELGGGKEKKWE